MSDDIVETTIRPFPGRVLPDVALLFGDAVRFGAGGEVMVVLSVWWGAEVHPTLRSSGVWWLGYWRRAAFMAAVAAPSMRPLSLLMVTRLKPMSIMRAA